MVKYILWSTFLLIGITLQAQVKYTDYPGEIGPNGLVRCVAEEVLEVQKLKAKDL